MHLKLGVLLACGIDALMLLAGCIYGWQALTLIGRSNGRLSGGVAAGFAALLVPVVATWLGCYVAWECGITAYYGDNNYSDRKQAILVLGGSLTAIVLTIGWIWFAGRLARGQKTA